MLPPQLPTTAEALGQFFGGAIVGDGAAEIHELSPLSAAGTGKLAYYSDPKYGAELAKAEGAVVLTSPSLARPDLPVTFVLVDKPQLAFARLAGSLRPRFAFDGISPHAWVDPTAVLAGNVRVAPFAVIGAAATIGSGTTVGPHAYIAAGAVIGSDCEIQARATVLEQVRIGNRVRVFPGAVIGGEGFGVYSDGSGVNAEMPQVGTVIIEDDVRVGANVSIARATLAATRIGRGTKIDDLVMVGHNVQTGENCILCGAAALGGSVKLGVGVIVGGQAGLGHGVEVGAGARIGGLCGTSANLDAGESYTFTPAVPVREGHRIYRNWRRLPEIWKRLRRVEERLGIESSSGGEA